MNDDLLKRAQAMIAAAVAESRSNGAGRIVTLHLTVYPTPETPVEAIRTAIDAARRGTPAEGAQLRFSEASTRYICWNCCGLRFEGRDGTQCATLF